MVESLTRQDLTPRWRATGCGRHADASPALFARHAWQDSSIQQQLCTDMLALPATVAHQSPTTALVPCTGTRICGRCQAA